MKYLFIYFAPTINITAMSIQHDEANICTALLKIVYVIVNFHYSWSYKAVFPDSQFDGK